MQTFLPYPDFAQSAKCLDRLRLGKQRLECWQIYRTIIGESQGWRNHPAIRMWRGYEASLLEYGIEVCWEWRRRGYKDTIVDRLYAVRLGDSHDSPDWLGGKIHSTHRAALLYKDPVWYSKFGWTETPEINYWWPK